MSESTTLPATMPAEFVDCSVYAGSEVGFYRLELGGVIAFDDRLDESRLRRALQLLLVAEPILRYRFDAETPIWRRLDDLDDFELLEVRQSDAPADEAAGFIPLPFGEATPLLAALLLRGPSADTLAVRVGHVAADGGALKETMNLIGDLYRKLDEDPGWTPEPNLDGLRHPVLHVGLIERLRLLSRSEMDLSPKSEWVLHILGGRGPASYVSARVEAEVFHEAIALGKSAGATVGDVILTAYYRTLCSLLRPAPGSPTPVMTTVDLRKYLPEGTKTALANLSSTSTMHLSPVDGEGFDATLARMTGVTREWKSADGGRANVASLIVAQKLFGKRAVKFFRGQFSKVKEEDSGERDTGALPIITNIGLIDAERLDFGTSAHVVDAWLFAPAGPLGLALAASTYRERLHLSQGTEFAGMDEGLIRGIVEGTGREIEGWVAASQAQGA